MISESVVNDEREQSEPAPPGAQEALPARRAWNADQVAARLGCSARHVYRMADMGVMPWGFKLGFLRRWDADEIESWIAGGAKPVRQKGGRP